MSDEKEAGRSRRKKRRGQQAREKDLRRESLKQTARLESKAKDAKEQLDQRITKLIEKGYSIESVAKRVGVTQRRINTALDAARRTAAFKNLGAE